MTMNRPYANFSRRMNIFASIYAKHLPSLSHLFFPLSLPIPLRRTLSLSSSHRKEEFRRTKPHFNVGTIGHVDHGKTSLTSAITKVLSESKLASFHPYDKIDHLPEERRRGITINARHVEYQTSHRHYSHVDCPGHIDFVKNMIVGSFQTDGAILVLAANSGVMPQTREHIILAKQIGLDKLVVFINKADLVDSATTELCEDEIREMLSDHGFDGDETPVVVGSAKVALEEQQQQEVAAPNITGSDENDGVSNNNNKNNNDNESIGKGSILKLLSTMDEYFALPSRCDDRPSLLPVDRVYSILGRGTVVTGILQSGALKKGDSVDILGYDVALKSTVGSIETFHKTLSVTEPGDNIGVLLRGVRKPQLKRGMMVAKSGSIAITNRVKARVYLLDSDEGGLDEPLFQDNLFKLFSQTFHVIANVNRITWGDDDGAGGDFGVVDERQMVMPGEETTMELMMFRKMFLPKGSRFTLRTHSLTVGYGVVTEVMKEADEAMLKKRWRKWRLPLSK